MQAFLRRRGPTIAVAALMFVAGGATVTTAQNLITSADIQNGTIRTVDLADNAVTSRKIANGHVRRPDIRNTAVNAPKILDGAVRRPKIANTAVNAAKIANGAVTRAKIANNAVGTARIANGAVTNSKLANNSVNSAKIANGSIQLGDISAAAQGALTAFSGPNWSIVDRGVIGNGDSHLRAGPSAAGPAAPPLGIGSVGIRTGAGTDRAAFGNQVDFVGDPVSGLTAVGYSVFTTGENNGAAPNNMPSIAFEINPNLTTFPGVGFSTIVYLPENGAPNVWSNFNAVTDPANHWGGTGAAFAGSPCDINGTRCTFAQLQAHLASDGTPDAIIFTAQITKGRDFAFSGAVDAFRINNVVYDFEPTGVFETAP